MRFGGIAFMILGGLLMIGSLLVSPTVDTGSAGGLYGAPAQVYNLGALQYQELFFIAGAAFLIAGSVLYSVGALLERLEASGVIKMAGCQPVTNAAPAASDGAADGLTEYDDSSGGCRWCGRSMLGGKQPPCSRLPIEELRRLHPLDLEIACQQVVGTRLDAAAVDRP